MRRGLLVVLPVVTLVALVVVALLAGTSPSRLASSASPRRCTNTFAVESDPEHPADALSLQAATAALHGPTFQTLGLSAEYRKAIAAAVVTLHPAGAMSTVGETLSDEGGARQYILSLLVRRKLTEQGIDTDGMLISGDYVCDRSH